jgi:hypothetical protein
MRYIIPKSINVDNISFKEIKHTLSEGNNYKIYYRYKSLDLIGIPFLLKAVDYVKYIGKIIIKNDVLVASINRINDHILLAYPRCKPIIYNDTIYHSSHIKPNGDIYVFISSVNTSKNIKKAKLHFIT